MQLPAHEIRIDVVGLRDVGSVLVVGQPVAAVRDVHFLLADELPVEAIDRALEHGHVVPRSRTGGTRVRCVAAEVRRELHASLSGQVLPRAARLLQRIDRIDDEDRLAVAPGRADVEQLAVEIRLGSAQHTRLLRVVDGPRPECVGGHRERRDTGRVDVVVAVARAVVSQPAVAQQVIPDRFGAGLGYRKRITGQDVLERNAVFDGLCPGRVLERVVEDPLRNRDRAMRRIDVNAHRRVALEQFLGAFGELVGMGRHVLAPDRQARLLAGERIRPHGGSRLEAGRCLDAARVFGNRAVLVARLLGAHRRQRRSQLLGLVGRHRRECRSSDQRRDGECQYCLSVHDCVPLRMWS